MIERGANVNARSPNGSTPLMMAAREGREEIARTLLESGTDTRARITSYNVCYTKLLRLALRAGLAAHFPDETMQVEQLEILDFLRTHPPFCELPEDRITSYNVCYTKLLRR